VRCAKIVSVAPSSPTSSLISAVSFSNKILCKSFFIEFSFFEEIMSFSLLGISKSPNTVSSTLKMILLSRINPFDAIFNTSLLINLSLLGGGPVRIRPGC
jgi:hypothetical protein